MFGIYKEGDHYGIKKNSEVCIPPTHLSIESAIDELEYFETLNITEEFIIPIRTKEEIKTIIDKLRK